jgi:3-hydroxyacyl-CoA dehydrogenase/enoyl-CoA hydratase/3-hydroxybutyryl-CoA epimerase
MIDQAMRRFGMPMGPLELLDQIGLDVAWHITKPLQPYFGSRFQVGPAFEAMHNAGYVGQKAGRGFYVYGRKRPADNPPVPVLIRHAMGSSARTGGLRREDRRAISNRLVSLMVNEAAACLGEGLAADAAAIDLAMVLGTGWAPHRGGPLRYADDGGLPAILRVLEEFAQPCEELRRRAETGERFYEPSRVSDPRRLEESAMS